MKILKVLAVILLVAIIALPLIPVQAAGPTYTADINVDNASSTSYTNVPVKVTIPNFDYLVSNGYITEDGTDIQVTTLGGSKLPRMLNEDGDLVFLAPSLPASSTSKFKLTLGNTPEDFAVITDEMTVLDNPDMEQNPIYSFTSTTSDGTIYSNSRSAPSGTLYGGAEMPCGQQYNGTIYRGYLFFDTSALPNDKVISSAKLKLYVTNDLSTTDSDIVVQNGQPDYPHDPLQATDYNMTYYNGNGGSKNTNGISSNSWIEIPLNNDGIGWINTTGTTKLCLRSSRDISDIAPVEDEHVIFATAESANDPVLEVIYNNFPLETEFKGYIDTSSTGDLVSKTDAILINVSGANTLSCSITGGPTVTASSVSSGEHTVKVIADGTDLKLYVDGILEDSEAFTGVIPDKTSNWIIGSGAMSRISYYKHTVGGVLKAWYQPNSTVPLGTAADAVIFPTVVSTNSNTNAATTSHTLNLPATRNVGDLLMASISTVSNPTITWPDGWTALFTKANSTYVSLSVAYRIIDGSEGSSITITTSASQASSCQSYTVTDYQGVPAAGTAQASNDPPSLTSGFGTVNTLWLAVDGSTIATPAIPANYTNLVYTGTASPWLHSAYRNLKAASEDPGAFTSGNYQVTNTLAVCVKAPYLVPDRAGGDQNGALDEVSNSSGITVDVFPLTPYNIPMPQPGGGAGDIPVIVGESGQPGWTEDTLLSSNPFYPAVAVISDVTDIPERQIWAMGALMCVTAAMLAVFKFVPHQLITVIVGGIVTALFVAQGILPFWVIFIFVLLGIAIVLWERVPSV